MKTIYRFLTVLFFAAVIISANDCKSVKAAGIEDSIEYDEIQKLIEKEEISNLDFQETVDSLIEDDSKSLFSRIIDNIVESFGNRLKQTFKTIASILSLVLILAVFKNISSTFRNGQVSETGFYAAYLMMFGNIGMTVFASCKIAAETITLIIDFMKVLIPAYSFTVAVSSGAGSSAAIYEGVLILITICELIMLKIIIPLINIYMLISLAGRINNEGNLSKLGEMIVTIIEWLQKGIIGLVLGVGAVKGLLTPAVDSVRRSSLIKLTSFIPGVGNAISGVAETVFGAAALVRNAVGIAGIIVIFIICAIPLVKLLVYVICYKAGAAFVQPVSDNRVTECLNSASVAVMLLFKTTSYCMLMFILTIAITASATK